MIPPPPHSESQVDLYAITRAGQSSMELLVSPELGVSMGAASCFFRNTGRLGGMKLPHFQSRNSKAATLYTFIRESVLLNRLEFLNNIHWLVLFFLPRLTVLIPNTQGLLGFCHRLSTESKTRSEIENINITLSCQATIAKAMFNS